MVRYARQAASHSTIAIKQPMVRNRAEMSRGSRMILDTLGGETPPGRSPWWPFVIGVCIALTIWCIVDVRRRARVDGRNPHSSDFTVYTEAGAAFFDGRDPYAVTNLRGSHYLYPPLFAILVAPLHSLDPPWQATVWFALSAAMSFGCFFECRSIARSLDIPGSRDPLHSRAIPWWIGVAALLAVLLPTLDCLQRGQVGVAVTYLLLVGYRQILQGRAWPRWTLGGAVLAMPVALKLTPILPVGFVLFQQFASVFSAGERDRLIRRAVSSSLGILIGGLLFFLIVPGVFVGWSANLRHLHTWLQRVVISDLGADRFFDFRSVRNQSMSNAVSRFGRWLSHAVAGGPDDRLFGGWASPVPQAPMGESIVAEAMIAVRLALLAMLLISGFWLSRGGDAIGQAAAFGLACALTLLISPVSWGHHYTLLLPAVLFVPLWLWQRKMPRASLTIATIPALLSLLHYGLLEYTGRIGLLGIGTTLWFLVICGMIPAASRVDPESVAPERRRRKGRSCDEPVPTERPEVPATRRTEIDGC